MFEVYRFAQFSDDIFSGAFETLEEAIEECHEIWEEAYVVDTEIEETVWREFPSWSPMLRSEKVEEPKKKTLVERLLDIIK